MLSLSELQELESTLLPALERHHLRLLAHGLRTLQSIASSDDGAVPDPERILAWLLLQEAIGDDPAFAQALRTQLCSVLQQLEAIAGPGRSPLSLELSDLMLWARQQADQRLSPVPR